MKEVKELLSEIMQEAYEVSKNTDVEISVKYSPHVHFLEIEIHEGSWTNKKIVSLRMEVYLDHEYSTEKLKDILRRIKNYK